MTDEPTPAEQHAMAMTADMISDEMTALLEAFDDLAFSGTVASMLLAKLMLDYPEELVGKAYITHIAQAKKMRAFLLQLRAKEQGKH